jgi:hypothetical protein
MPDTGLRRSSGAETGRLFRCPVTGITTVAFGAPQGQRVGDAVKAMPLHRLAAATPPMTLRRPNPKGASALRTISASRPGPDAQRHRIPARDIDLVRKPQARHCRYSRYGAL